MFGRVKQKNSNSIDFAVYEYFQIMYISEDFLMNDCKLRDFCSGFDTLIFVPFVIIVPIIYTLMSIDSIDYLTVNVCVVLNWCL